MRVIGLHLEACTQLKRTPRLYAGTLATLSGNRMQLEGLDSIEVEDLKRDLAKVIKERDAAWKELANLRSAVLHLRSLEYFEIIPRDEKQYNAADAAVEAALKRVTT